MNKIQEEKLASLRVIYSIAMKHPETISKVELFREGIDELGKLIEEIESVSSQQSMDITGVNIQKMNARNEILDHLINIAGDIRSYASLNNNHELFEKANLKRGKLLLMRQLDFISAGRFLIDELKKIPVSFLEKAGYTEEVLSEIEVSFENFNNLFSEPRLRLNERKNLTIQLDQLFRKATEIKKGMLDDHINKFKSIDSNFHQLYMDAAHIIRRR